MSSRVRDVLWNRAVALAFALPAAGYLAFLSQFVLDDPPGTVETLLNAVFLFALPVAVVYSALLDAIGPVNQTAGTVGFFVFAYILAVAVVQVVRYCVRLLRGRSGTEEGPGDANS